MQRTYIYYCGGCDADGLRAEQAEPLTHVDTSFGTACCHSQLLHLKLLTHVEL